MPRFNLGLGFASILVPAGLASVVLLAQAPSELSGIYTIQQQSSKRYVDAHPLDQKDWAVVTRHEQDNPTQKWIFSRVTNAVYTIQQQSNGRYLDAHDTPDKDYAVVTRAAQNNATQRWIVTRAGSNTYSIQQQNTRRYMDAH